MTGEFPFLDAHRSLFSLFRILKNDALLYLPLKARLSKANSCFAFSGSSSGTSFVSIKKKKQEKEHQ